MMERVEVQDAINKLKIDAVLVILVIKKCVSKDALFLFLIRLPTRQNMINQG